MPCSAGHAEAAAAARGRLQAMGLRLVADEESASNTVTAAWLPSGVAWPELTRTLRQRHGIVLAGGLGQLQGKILRLGHLGWTRAREVHRAADALETCLRARVATATAPVSGRLSPLLLLPDLRLQPG